MPTAMLLRKIPTVLIQAVPLQDFIIIKLVGNNGANKTVVRTYDPWFYKFFVPLMSEELGTRIICLGGGKMYINSASKTIRIEGSNSHYGQEPDRQKTLKMIQTAYSGFKIRLGGLRKKPVLG